MTRHQSLPEGGKTAATVKAADVHVVSRMSSRNTPQHTYQDIASLRIFTLPLSLSLYLCFRVFSTLQSPSKRYSRSLVIWVRVGGRCTWTNFRLKIQHYASDESSSVNKGSLERRSTFVLICKKTKSVLLHFALSISFFQIWFSPNVLTRHRNTG